MENNTKIIEKPVKTFKEVHKELEDEAAFLTKNHDIRGFKEKADFLTEAGFVNSIATKLYKAVAENHKVVEEYEKKYRGQYKFILEPQLERILEKYDLYLRNIEDFLGDIPEKNIKDIMKFEVFLNDLNFYGNPDFRQHHQYMISVPDVNIGFSEDRFKISSRYINHFKQNMTDNYYGHIVIASVKSLLSERAFKDSSARIVKKQELVAKNKVELDPIVLCRTKHGYLIITAWGDEANDELVVNQKMN